MRAVFAAFCAFGLSAIWPVGAMAENGANHFTGLWAGSVHVTHVQAPDGAMAPVQTPFEFGLVIHRDPAGGAHLVTQAVVIGQAAGTAAGRERQVITGSDISLSLLAGFSPDALAGAEKYATVGYDLPSGVQTMTGDFGGSGVLTASLSLRPFDDENPFRHRFHPDHDNLSAAGEPLPDDGEVFALTRHMRFEFNAEQSSPGRLVGVFSETILGLRAAAIPVRGLFVLEQVFRQGDGS